MPGTRRVFLNDNIRTEHLKCSCCRTQVYLISITADEDGGETRVFACPHCASSKSLRLEPRRKLPDVVADHIVG